MKEVCERKINSDRFTTDLEPKIVLEWRRYFHDDGIPLSRFFAAYFEDRVKLVTLFGSSRRTFFLSGFFAFLAFGNKLSFNAPFQAFVNHAQNAIPMLPHKLRASV